MPDHKETQCPWCGSRQHHPDRCPQAPGVVAAPEPQAPQGSLRCDGVVGRPLLHILLSDGKVKGWTHDPEWAASWANQYYMRSFVASVPEVRPPNKELSGLFSDYHPQSQKTRLPDSSPFRSRVHLSARDRLGIPAP